MRRIPAAALLLAALPAAAACPPLLDHRMGTLKGGATDLCQYAGRVVMVVNTASYCGYTGQYKGLESLFQRYKDRGFVVLGVPSNDFGAQEPGTDEQVADFCERTYKVRFPMLAKSVVSGPEAIPLYRGLAARTAAGPGLAPRPRGLLAEGLGGETAFAPVFVNGRRLRWGVEGAWRSGPVSLRAEWLEARERRLGQGPTLGGLPELVGRGWPAPASWLVTGERKRDTVRPERPLFGGPGAVELALRYDVVRFDDAENAGFEGAGNRSRNVRPAGLECVTAGVSWWRGSCWSSSPTWRSSATPTRPARPSRGARAGTASCSRQLSEYCARIISRCWYSVCGT